MDKVSWKFIRNVIIKAFGIFAIINFAFIGLPQSGLGDITLYNRVFPGRLRFPFGEHPERSYNFSLYNIEAMFVSHILDGSPRISDEFRVFIIGDSSIWGTLLKPEQTLAGQLNAAGLVSCDGKKIRIFNLGYPTISLTKDLMILERAMRYQPDLIVWPVTLEAFPLGKQISSPIVTNNPDIISRLFTSYGLNPSRYQQSADRPFFWDRTLIGQRRGLADLFRLQLYGVMWAATGIDQDYPQRYEPAQRDLEADTSYGKWHEPDLPDDQLALEVIEAGIKLADKIPVLLINEPILISTGKNSEIRYNFFYPKWAYDSYRIWLSAQAANRGWRYFDFWNLAAEKEFTNSAIHLTPAGETLLAEQIEMAITGEFCKNAR